MLAVPASSRALRNAGDRDADGKRSRTGSRGARMITNHVSRATAKEPPRHDQRDWARDARIASGGAISRRRRARSISIERRRQRIPGARSHRVEQSPRVVLREGWEIEEASDVVHIEQVHLVGSTRETDRDDRHPRQELVALPWLEWYGGQQVILTEDNIRAVRSRGVDCVVDPNDAHRIHAVLSKELPEVIAQIRVSPDTQCLQRYSLGTGDVSRGHRRSGNGRSLRDTARQRIRSGRDEEESDSAVRP